MEPATFDVREPLSPTPTAGRFFTLLAVGIFLLGLLLGVANTRLLTHLEIENPVRMGQVMEVIVPLRGSVHGMACGQTVVPKGLRMVVRDRRSRAVVATVGLEEGRALSAKCALAIWDSPRGAEVNVVLEGTPSVPLRSQSLRVGGDLDAPRAVPVALVFLGLALLFLTGPASTRVEIARWSSRQRITRGVMAFLGLVLANVIGAVVVAGSVAVTRRFDATAMALAMVLQHGSLAAFSAVMIARDTRGPSLPVRLGMGKLDLRMALVSVSAGLALLGVAGLVTRFVTDPELTPIGQQLQSIPMRYGFAFTALLAPLSEELYFRGVLFRLVELPTQERKSAAYWMPVFASALFFAAMHAMQLRGAFLGLVPILAVGLVNGVLRRVTDGLTAPWLVHSIYNGAIVASVFFGA